MRNSRGYVYAEMLVAFLTCLFLVGSVLAIFQEIQADRKNTTIKSEAYHLLYEALTAYITDTGEAKERSLNRQGIVYRLTWESTTELPEMLKGCIEYKDMEGEMERICDYTKR